MSADALDQKITWVRAAARAAGRDPDTLEFQLRMFDVRVRHRGTEHLSSGSHVAGWSSADLAASPVALHGDVSECVDRLVALRDRFGISYLHLGGNLAAAAPIVARLAGR